jgi:hypothetical protein
MCEIRASSISVLLALSGNSIRVFLLIAFNINVFVESPRLFCGWLSVLKDVLFTLGSVDLSNS